MKKITIGKSSSNDIVVSSDPTVSRSHSFIHEDSYGEVFITDLNSTNGSYVNGERVVNKKKLNKLDIITVGNTV